MTTSSPPLKQTSEPAPGDDGTPSRTRWKPILVTALLVVLGLEFGARFVASQSSFGEDLLPRLLDEHRTNADARDEAGQATDILFFGTSTAGAAFDPNMVDDRRGYDLWWAGAGTETLDAFAESFALTLFDTDTVVVGVTSRELNDSRAAENRVVLDDATRALAWRRVANRDPLTLVELFASRVSALVRYRSDLRRPTSWLSWMAIDVQPEGLTTDSTGRLTRYRDRPEPEMSEGDIAREVLALSDYSTGGRQADGLVSTLETLGDKRVLLVFLPVSFVDYGPLHPNGIADIDAARAVARDAAAEAGVEFLDASDIGEDRTLFGDANHLNQRGSEILTQRVLDALGA